MSSGFLVRPNKSEDGKMLKLADRSRIEEARGKRCWVGKSGDYKDSYPDWREVMVLVEPLKISKIVSWPVPLFFNISLILQN